MVWLQPAALWLLALAAVPIAIHLLRTRRAKRVAFPSLRFVRPSQTASIRVHAPSDLLLLALRTAIVVLAVLACAQPLWITAAREASWNARTARAVVVDTSESMGDPASAEAIRAARARHAEAFTSRTFESAEVRDGVARAVSWLRQVPPARREIVIVSDFQTGGMTSALAATVPASVGLRFERVVRSNPVSLPAMPRLTAPGAGAQSFAIALSERGTTVEVQGGAASESRGVRVIGSPGQERQAAALVRALVAAGTPAPDPVRPVAIRTGSAIAAGDARPVVDRWMIEIVAGLSRDPEVNRLARTIPAAVPVSDPWTVVVRGQSGQAVVRAAASGNELTLDSATPLESYFTAALARATLRLAPWARPPVEADPGTVPDSILAALRREPGPADTTSWQSVEHSDARWFWGTALILLVAEALLRNRSTAAKEVQRAAA